MANLVSYGWIGILVILLISLRRQIKMLVMWLVFQVYSTPHEDRNKWLLREARRNDAMTFAREFWSRSSRRKLTRGARRPPTAGRRAPASMVDVPSDREPRQPAA